ncbi:MAG: cyclic GMP-AMP synthase DncV-like nucleotidyltransferase [Sphingomonadaceae bacterium]
MFDYSKKVTNFHDIHVTLTMSLRRDMKSRRDANKKRIIDGLDILGKPSPIDWINQGGYAQQTMTQPPEGDEDSRYDIDMGVVFDEADAKTPATTKRWVRDAIAEKASGMKNEPECKPKCVRVVYADGYQCDFPVFQKCSGLNDTHELASSDSWVASDPRSMNAWIDERVSSLSPECSGVSQLRQIIRLIKYFAKVKAFKKSRKFPSGLLVTALAIENYIAVEGRLDEAFRETLRRISSRSKHQAVFANGIQISDNKDTERLSRMIESAVESVEHLDNLHDDIDEETARKSWKKVFQHSYFDEVESKSASATTNKYASAAAGALGISSSVQAERAAAAVSGLKSSGTMSKPFAFDDESNDSQ